MSEQKVIISEMMLQAQMKMSDGTVMVLNTPALAPTEDLSPDDVRSTLMGLGEDLHAKMMKRERSLGGIVEANSPLVGPRIFRN